ncbi:CtsR family transcriptional regulator [Clostridium tarantellae]|uniref:CtsR family transcriptional regulator n=1 Tax=Clostridium tarantellae TaxID=39493 RepID=A0A6I1MIX0_9CLOT|nr:CtsR family transcriptional regulator [Clostridium tarantellae]MPQ42348.1 CtsR family transcriptional regulator [Clostridium tarantellae]
MSKLSNTIESFIKILLEKSKNYEIKIQRNEIAKKFKCAPSQINYVLNTRFSYNKGYLIESKRGGGGHIKIKRVSYQSKDNLNRIIIEQIGESIKYNEAIILIQYLNEIKIIDDINLNLIKVILNERTLKRSTNKNKLRADILKAMIISLIK